MAKTIIPVVLSGGVGKRLFPISTPNMPKQFCKLNGEEDLFSQTLQRLDNLNFAKPIITTNVEHRFLVAEFVRRAGVEVEQIILEPEIKNNAAAICASALYVRENFGEDAVMLVVPSDHIIDDANAFADSVAEARELAEAGKIMCFGIRPECPETKYGYIKPGSNGEIESFTEKPDLETAESYLASGEYFWNSGIFVFKCGEILEEYQEHAPDLYENVQASYKQAYEDLDFIRLGEESYEKTKKTSIDYAILEKTESASMIVAKFDWQDFGSYEALWSNAKHDEFGNAKFGNVKAEDARGNYIYGADGVEVNVSGLEGFVVAASKNRVMVAPKDAEVEIQRFAEVAMSGAGSEKVYRPWGHYEVIEERGNYKLKVLEILPGKKISTQSHQKRSEHWTCVAGKGQVRLGDKKVELVENISVFVPKGEVHCLENTGSDVLRIIEVQIGDYLGEDDIERYS